ncbi:MAG: hypothetical protein K0U98_06140 [Deltaproteobacteria bacterium]|nr:hypothetical protein [Deltaproteobacteria bacterium]
MNSPSSDSPPIERKAILSILALVLISVSSVFGLEALSSARDDRPPHVLVEDWQLLEEARDQVSKPAGGAASLQAFSAGPATGCGFLPSRPITTGRTYDGRAIGGRMDLAMDPWRFRPGSQEFRDASRIRYALQGEIDAHHLFPGGGWCSGSRCGIGIHGADIWVFRHLTEFYLARPAAQRPVELRSIDGACNDRELWDLMSTGSGWPLLERWIRDRDGQDPRQVAIDTTGDPHAGPLVLSALGAEGASCRWTFSPASPGAHTCRVVRTFPPGRYTATLTATWPNGQTARARQVIEVSPPSPAGDCPEGESCLLLWSPLEQRHDQFRVLPPGRSTAFMDLMWNTGKTSG